MTSRGRAAIVVPFLTTHQRVVDGLGRRIVGGAWEPGDPLPVEIGVSRGVVREAVKATGLRVVAESEDGTIEAVERRTKVQPERAATEAHPRSRDRSPVRSSRRPETLPQ
jgi:DNA-binding FadR family transcriptional regulator